MSKKLIGVGVALTLLSLLSVMLSQVQARSPVVATKLFPTFTLMPTATFDPNAFSLVGASTFKAPNDVIEMLLPKSFQPSSVTEPGRYSFYFGPDQNPTINLQIQITTPAELIAAATPPTNARQALQAIRDAFAEQIKSGQLTPTTTQTTIAPLKIGKLTGVGFILSVPDVPAQPGAVLDLRIADLPHGRILFTYTQSSNPAWPRAKQLLATMLDSLVVHPDAVPTATPTATPISLELTATSLQSQLNTVEAKIYALTATPTLAK